MLLFGTLKVWVLSEPVHKALAPLQHDPLPTTVSGSQSLVSTTQGTEEEGELGRGQRPEAQSN